MLTRSHQASWMGNEPWIRDEYPPVHYPTPHGGGAASGGNANRRDRQQDAKRHILFHSAALTNGPAGQAVHFADVSPLAPFRCLSRREKVGSKPCFRFTQTSCPAGLKAGSRGSQ